MRIGKRSIARSEPTYIIAELSANHGQDLAEAIALVQLAADAGADAVKIQTYTPDTLTIDSRRAEFIVGQGTPWAGRSLYDLYGEAFTPWAWHDELAQVAERAGVDFFSTPFDTTAVDFLLERDVPAIKIASFELIDLPLIRYAASTGKPMILSTGMATEAEIDTAVRTARDGGANGVAILRCNSAYPAPVEEMDLATIPDMARRWPDAVIGLSDHTLGTTAAIVAVTLGARVLEKHFTRSRAVDGPDAAFSLEPDEFRELVRAVRDAEAALGDVRYGPTEREKHSLVFRRSLFVVEDVRAGEPVTTRNVRSIRPGNGLPPSDLDRLLGRAFRLEVERGTPLTEDLLVPLRD